MTDEQQDEQFYRDTEGVAFPKLNDHQLSLLEPLGERRLVERGDLVYKAGQRDLGLTILLRGEIEAFEQRDDSEQILANIPDPCSLNLGLLPRNDRTLRARLGLGWGPGKCELF